MAVKHEGGRLHVPVTAGVVYRLAKAPAYVLMPKGMPRAEARHVLTSAVLA